MSDPLAGMSPPIPIPTKNLLNRSICMLTEMELMIDDNTKNKSTLSTIALLPILSASHPKIMAPNTDPIKGAETTKPVNR
jgi:hypothetical protein